MEKAFKIKNSKIFTDIMNKTYNTAAGQFNYIKENAPKFHV